MKINNKDLKNLYKEHTIETVSSSRKKCPSTEEIIQLARSKLSSKHKSKIADHASNCFHCSQKLKYILQTLNQENILITDIDHILRSENGIPSIKR